MKIFVVLFLLLLFGHNAFAWDGYDRQNDAAIEIGRGNLVREGNIIKIYDWKEDEYHDVEVRQMEDSFKSVRLEVYDLDSQQERIFDMEN